MSVGAILLILVVIFLLGGLPFGVYGGPYAVHYGGGGGLILLILILLLVFGRI